MKKLISGLVFSLLFIISAEAAPPCPESSGPDAFSPSGTDPACYTSETVSCSWVDIGDVFCCADFSATCFDASASKILCSTGFETGDALFCSGGRCDNYGGVGVKYADWDQNSCGGTPRCTNQGAKDPGSSTTDVCHYISSVTSWSACEDGSQFATGVNWAVIDGTSCSNVPLTQTCCSVEDCSGSADVCEGQMYFSPSDACFPCTGTKPPSCDNYTTEELAALCTTAPSLPGICGAECPGTLEPDVETSCRAEHSVECEDDEDNWTDWGDVSCGAIPYCAILEIFVPGTCSDCRQRMCDREMWCEDQNDCKTPSPTKLCADGVTSVSWCGDSCADKCEGASDYDYETASDAVSPTAVTSLSTEDWTNTFVTSSLTNCADVTTAGSTAKDCETKTDGDGYVYLSCEYASGCNNTLNDAQAETIYDYGEVSALTATDKSGKTRSIESNPVQIDYLAPVFNADPEIEMLFEGTTYSEVLTQASVPQFVANDQFEITFDVVDQEAQTASNGYESGKSGLSSTNSTVTITGVHNGPVESENFVNGTMAFSNLTLADTYTMDLYIEDNAGNFVTLTRSFEVVAANADQGATGSTVSGPTCNTVLANNSDACVATAVIKDRFENVIKDRDYGFNEISGQDQAGSYDLMVDAEQAFLNGLRVETGTITATGDLDLTIKSLVPTVLVASVTKGGDTVYYIPEVGGEIKRNADVTIDVKDVNGRGNVDGTASIIDLTMNDLEYKPWVDLYLTDLSSQELSCPGEVGTSDPLEINVGSEDFTIYVCAKNAANRVLPTGGLGTRVIGHTSDTMNFESDDIDKDINSNPDGLALTLGAGGTKQTTSITTRLTTEGGSIVDLGDIAISSRVAITIDGHEVVYPGGSIGIGMVFKGVVIGADIEGSVLGTTSKISYVGGESALIKTGGISATDVREEITQNAYALVRSATPSQTNVTLSRLDFTGGNIKYYKGVTVTLEDGGDNEVLVEGKGTIVIEDGNLQINSNLKYNTGSDSLGVIMINTSSAATPSTGNVYVYKDVQNIVGTYFADGGLMTTLSPVGYLEPTDRDVQLTNQLILMGTILTRNTLGGSLFDPMQTPWGLATGVNDEAKEDQAQAYDLNFVRRYGPTSQSDCPGASVPEDVVCSVGCVPQKNDASKCDTSTHAFVVRPDSKVSNMTPPGFSSVGTIGQ